jgi:hypothetical protein
MSCLTTIRTHHSLLVLTSSLLAILLLCSTVLAVPMKDDPNGFEGIPWGTTLSESDRFKKVEDTGRAKTYEPRTSPPTLGTIQVESIKFTAFGDKFARVTVRYKGKDTHDKILAFLQSRYGKLDRIPGQFSVGPVKFFAWQGFETEVTLRYEIPTDRGIIFIESQTMRLSNTEGNSGTVF